MLVTMKKRLFFLLIFMLYLCFESGIFPVFPRPAGDLQVIAHRGDSANAPENTLPAFASAIRCRSNGIEMDIRLTGDGVPVVLHDANLRRLTGNDLQVSRLTGSEVLSQTLISHAEICSLEEALLFCNDHPDLRLHLELKVDGAEEKVVSLMQKYDSVGCYEISSSDRNVLRKIKQLAPRVSTFLVLSSPVDLWNYALQNADYIDGISVKSVRITASLALLARRRGHTLYAWTVNTPFELQRMKRLGANAVITDDPGKIRSLLADD